MPELFLFTKIVNMIVSSSNEIEMISKSLQDIILYL